METEWKVSKTGAYMFDQEHALGLGTILTYVTGEPVTIEDVDRLYRLKTAAFNPHLVEDKNIFEKLFPLPLPNNELAEVKTKSEAIFDGLLALLFTTPGVRLVSVSDALYQQKYKPDAVVKGLKKANKAVARWQKYVMKQSRHSENWLVDLLQYYRTNSVQNFLPSPKRTQDLVIPITIDPPFGYASRSPFSNGQISQKCNVAMRKMPYAVFLSLIGATRWLRAQRVTGNLVNYYLPLFSKVKITNQSFLPPLEVGSGGLYQSLLQQWFSIWQIFGEDVLSLAYHTMQTQGVQQSISLSRGNMDYQWLANIEKTVGMAVIQYWQRCLNKANHQLELDLLEDSLLHPQSIRWLHHWRSQAIQLLAKPEALRPYHLLEIKEIVNLMEQPTSLSTVLTQDSGTIRFGFALRQLGKVRPSVLKELVEELDAVHTQGRMLRVLAEANQACLLAKAQSDFIIIPTDDDLTGLLNDIAQFGAKEIAALLIILSTLRYPRREDKSQDMDMEVENETKNE